MPRPRTGSAVALWKKRRGKRVKVWYGCISYFAENGKRKFERRRADNKTHAKELAQTMLREYDDGGQEIFDSADMTLPNSQSTTKLLSWSILNTSMDVKLSASETSTILKSVWEF